MDIISKYADTFFAETGKLLDEMDAILLADEGAKSFAAADINEMFRITHTLKGSFGMMGLEGLLALSHALEGVFVVLKRGEGALENQAALFDIMYDALDAMRQGVDDVAADGRESRSFETLIHRVKSFGASNIERRTLKITLKSDCPMENVRAYLIVSTLGGLCNGILYWPEALDADPDAAKKIRSDGLYISFPATAQEAVKEALDKDVFIAGVESAERFPTSDDKERPDDAAQNAPAQAAVMGGYVSVSLAKLEELRNMASDMALMLNRAAGGLAAEGDADAIKLTRACDRLQSAVVGLRLVPVSSLFQKLRRAVREAGRKLAKEIEFVQRGADVEIDKGIIDALSESLIQIVRNAAVHGIETPDERMRAGKPLMGRITVSARNSGTSVVVTVRDDGRGISAEAVASAAERAGFAPEKTPLTNEELLGLIMRPGVTTSGEADEMSGRGVGLDVVKTAVEKLRGSVTLETAKGAGTAFFVRIPQTLAVMDCIALGAGGHTFLIPALDIYALIRADKADVIPSNVSRDLLRFRGYTLPIVRPGKARLSGDKDDYAGESVFAVIEGEDSAAAVYAEKLIGPVKAAIKPLPALIERLNLSKCGVCGCAVLFDGGIGLILDAETLLNIAKE